MKESLPHLAAEYQLNGPLARMNADQRGFFGRLWGDPHPHLLAPVFECQNRVWPASLLAEIELERGTCWTRSSALSPQNRNKFSKT